MSTFADAKLATMSPQLLQQYDLFLDENDWDIYYWATQTASPTSTETAEGSGSDLATPAAQGSDVDGKGEGKDVVQEKDEWKREPASGEWAQTVGTFKPAYRPVPVRWRDSEILQKLRQHVKARSRTGETSGQEERKGLGMMPDIKSFDQ